MRREIYLNLILILLFIFVPCKFASLSARLGLIKAMKGQGSGEAGTALFYELSFSLSALPRLGYRYCGSLGSFGICI